IKKSSLSNLNYELMSSATVEHDSMSKEFISAQQQITTKAQEKHAGNDRVQQMLRIAGSILPDCSHAC
ncbi:hypothetical protein KI387_034235, partial [Taxus chinensis]